MSAVVIADAAGKIIEGMLARIIQRSPLNLLMNHNSKVAANPAIHLIVATYQMDVLTRVVYGESGRTS